MPFLDRLPSTAARAAAGKMAQTHNDNTLVDGDKGNNMEALQALNNETVDLVSSRLPLSRAARCRVAGLTASKRVMNDCRFKETYDSVALRM